MAMAPRALALLLLALTTAIPATSDARVRLATGGYILAECHQQAAAPSTSNGSDAARSAFRANLHPLLFDLPSAAGPTGFASLHYDNGPFVRGLCFDDSPQTGGCAGCLSAAAKKIADECGGSRRAGVWNAGCFVGYRDTNSSSPHEDAYRGREFSTDGVTYPAFYDAHELAALALSLAPLASVSNSGPMMATADTTTGRKGKVHAAAHCARDVTAADCARCLEKSAWELLPKSKCCGSWELDGQHEGVAVVAGFNCHLRLEIHAPDLPFAKKLREFIISPRKWCARRVPLRCRRAGVHQDALETEDESAVSMLVIDRLESDDYKIDPEDLYANPFG
ncbi:hypothetical protein ACQ4PT_052443 [Festuca glaucescens]